jgi:ribose-phosphate pyrophosphokinase
MLFLCAKASALRDSIMGFCCEHGISITHIAYNQFSDNETDYTLSSKVCRTDNPLNSVLIQLHHDANCDTVNMLVLADLLQVRTIFSPYLPYARDERVASILLGKNSCNEIFVCDIHKQIIDHDVACACADSKRPSVFNINSIEYFKDALMDLKNSVLDDVFVFAPDEGAQSRASLFAELLRAELLVGQKKRHGSEIVVSIPGEFKIKNTLFAGTSSKKQCMIVDDMISSGKTILAAIEAINALSSNVEFFVFATHLLKESQTIFRDNSEKILEKVGKLITTNIHPTRDSISSGKVIVVDVAEFLIKKALARQASNI